MKRTEKASSMEAETRKHQSKNVDEHIFHETSRGRMPSSGMDEGAAKAEMAEGEMSPNEPEERMVERLVEVKIPANRNALFALNMASAFDIAGFQVDTSFEPVPSTPSPDQKALFASSEEQIFTILVKIKESEIPALESNPKVIRSWKNVEIEPFALSDPIQESFVSPSMGGGSCPIGICDCESWNPKGDIEDVAKYLGVDKIWSAGLKGDGIVVGVVDGGITAEGRPTNEEDTSNPSWQNKLIPRVIGGWPADSWGTTGVKWGWHGNMCSTDVLGMAPQAKIYDIRISDGSFISNALSGFQWAINQHHSDGTPQILTCSFGIYQKNWDEEYASNPDHPFTRKVLEAIDEGIIVLFAAGNCGSTCPDGRCGSDVGPGKSIWGANGHKKVITVGAVNKNEQFVGYSSQGPSSLDQNKPDFCSITHFKGFNACDNGTSAATPVAAGIVALLKQSNASLKQDQAKSALLDTAKNIGPVGWNPHSGAGIIQAKAAYDKLNGVSSSAIWSNWENLGGSCTEGVAASSWGADRLDCFVVGNDRALWHKWWNGSTWSDWESLGGKLYSAPTAISWGLNRIDVFSIGGERAMWHKWFGKTA